MNRVFRLVGLVVAFIWLQGGVFQFGTLFGEPRAVGDFETPYWTCSGTMCVIREDGCGQTTCASNWDCGGCEAAPGAEESCLATPGATWNPNTCQCSVPACDAGQRQACANDWGFWHEDGCWCENPCNASAAVGQGWIVGEGTPGGCVDCCTRDYQLTMLMEYTQYCQDNRVWRQWTESQSFTDPRTDYTCAWEIGLWCSDEFFNPYYQC